MQPIVRDGGRTPAHILCEQFWHGTGSAQLEVALPSSLGPVTHGCAASHAGALSELVKKVH
jgi:hypothetical protein